MPGLDPAAVLRGWRQQAEWEASQLEPRPSSAYLPLLLAAVAAALGHHRRVPVYERVHDHKGNVVCGHDADYDGDRHFEGDDGEWLCADKPAGAVCSTCVDECGEPVEWQCGEYEAILAALNGERERHDPECPGCESCKHPGTGPIVEWEPFEGGRPDA